MPFLSMRAHDLIYYDLLASNMETITLYKLRVATSRLLRDAQTFDDLFFGIQDLQELIEQEGQK